MHATPDVVLCWPDVGDDARRLRARSFSTRCRRPSCSSSAPAELVGGGGVVGAGAGTGGVDVGPGGGGFSGVSS